jgi:transposase InsO family protein
VDRAIVSEKARRFLEHGMFGLVDRWTTTRQGRHHYPDTVAGYLLYLKQLYPPLHDRELVRIVRRKFGYTTNHHTLRRFLDHHVFPVQLPLPLTTFHQFDDAYQARWTVVRLWYEGWHQQSIAGCLHLSRKHVGEILAAFKRDGFSGLEDRRTRPPTHPANQLTLPFLKEVLEVQREYPRAGRFRVRGLLTRFRDEEDARDAPSERTVGRAMELNRRHHGAPPAWVTDRTEWPGAAAPDDVVKIMPYPPTERHRYWFIDYRYLVRLESTDSTDIADIQDIQGSESDGDDHWIYSLCVIEGYSRKILAGMATEYQDTIAVLQLLAAALAEYGRPAGIVSDNGMVFTSDAYQALLGDLGIAVGHIEKGQPWENLIEAQFKVQLRLADAKFAQAQTLEAVQRAHAAFVETFNTTPHLAHHDRADGVQTPARVLGWVRGQPLDAAHLQRAVRHLRVERIVNQRGYISVQRFYLYAERGLARTRVSVWLYDGRLHVAHQQTLLARYTYRYDRQARRLRAVKDPQLSHTPYASPQLELWELDEDQWRKIMPRPYERRPLPRPSESNSSLQQLALPMAIPTLEPSWPA